MDKGLTQKQIIMEVLKEASRLRNLWGDGWVWSFDLQKRNTKWGFIGISGDRVARELAKKGIIQRDEGIHNGKKLAKFRIWVFDRSKI